MKRIFFITTFFAFAIFLISSCGGGVKTDSPQVDVNELTANKDEVHGTLVKAGDISLENPLNAEWITAGSAIYEMKCQSCHRLDADRVVGPGWKDVTKTRKPEWIMNMITNVDVMLETDDEAQKLLEQCLIRMPNQNISFDEARQLLEFMRKNDGEN